jgi:integrase
MPKNVQEEEQALDQDDIRNILLKCNNRRLKTYILVLASSGVRAIEACAIRLCDIDFQHNPTRLHVRGEFTKTKVSRDIFISDEATRYLKDWIEYTFKINVDQTKNIDGPIAEYLVFQVHKNAVSSIAPIAIYRKLLSQFHIVLRSAGLGDRKESTKRRRITFHSIRRFVKTTISDSQAGSDYSEWFLGHRKNTYYVSKPTVRAEIYATKVMKYLTFHLFYAESNWENYGSEDRRN